MIAYIILSIFGFFLYVIFPAFFPQYLSSLSATSQREILPNLSAGIGGILLIIGIIGTGASREFNRRNLVRFWTIVLGWIVISTLSWTIFNKITDPIIYDLNSPFNNLSLFMMIYVILRDFVFFSLTFCFFSWFINYYFTYYLTRLVFKLIKLISSLFNWISLKNIPSYKITEPNNIAGIHISIIRKTIYSHFESSISGLWILMILIYLLPSSYFNVNSTAMVPKISIPMMSITLPTIFLFIYPLLILESSGVSIDKKIISPKKLHSLWSLLDLIVAIGILWTQNIDFIRLIRFLLLFLNIVFGCCLGYIINETRLVKKIITNI